MSAKLVGPRRSPNYLSRWAPRADKHADLVMRTLAVLLINPLLLNSLGKECVSEKASIGFVLGRRVGPDMRVKKDGETRGG